MKLDEMSSELLEKRVRERLATSLEQLWLRAEDTLNVEPDRYEPFIEAVRNYPQHPKIYARYYDLAFALMDKRAEDARNISNGLLVSGAQPIQSGIFALSEQELGEDCERFVRLYFAEHKTTPILYPPDSEELVTLKQRLSEAMNLVASVEPSVYDELSWFWPMIYLARPAKPEPKQTARFSFGNVTSFMVWGAGCMNIDALGSKWDIAGTLVHESTHALLFALSCDQPLVLNPVSEGYKSPLRKDLRPMIGIYHAAIVSARMLDFYRRALEGDVDEDRSTYLQQQLNKLRGYYDSGRDVIATHGNLTTKGKEILSICHQSIVEVA